MYGTRASSTIFSAFDSLIPAWVAGISSTHASKTAGKATWKRSARNESHRRILCGTVRSDKNIECDMLSGTSGQRKYEFLAARTSFTSLQYG